MPPCKDLSKPISMVCMAFSSGMMVKMLKMRPMRKFTNHGHQNSEREA